jgi:Ca-activated chloride channel homolog
MTFEWMYALWSLLLVPSLVALYLLAQRRRRAYAVRFTNLALLSSVVKRGPGVRRHIPPALFMLGLTALLISLARPVAVLAVPREQSSVMLVLDVSGSMSASDLQPSRMEAARQAARAFVNALPADTSVGLVAFSGEANIEAPLTRDRNVVLRAIANLQPGGGTAIGEGLSRALAHLEQQSGTAQDAIPARVVLLSDGQSTMGVDPAQAAARAANANVRVDTVGIGQRGATPMIGNQQRVGLDEATLQAMAERTGGQYLYASEANQLEALYADLGTQVRWVEERTEVTALVSALGALLLVIGGLLGLRWFQQFP